MSETTTAVQTGALTNIGFLELEKCEFYRNPNGFLCLRYEGEEHNRVQALRSLPLTQPDAFLCIQDMENQEIGILETLTTLPEGMAELVQEELERRYYCPGITDITSIKEKMGFYYFDVSIGGFKKTFSVKDLGKSIKELRRGGILITDVDGNRYLIPDLAKITPRCARQIEPYLY
ncbi:MAG: DUF1854 domain-containing protein [Oscillospiraceae bacterium]|jgi:hypothetical protein|nr:DUF1854 domain-containing protein [Oscillospiraceae bacterium]